MDHSPNRLNFTVGEIVGSTCMVRLVRSCIASRLSLLEIIRYKPIQSATTHSEWSAKPVFAGSIPARCSIGPKRAKLAFICGFFPRKASRSRFRKDRVIGKMLWSDPVNRREPVGSFCRCFSRFSMTGPKGPAALPGSFRPSQSALRWRDPPVRLIAADRLPGKPIVARRRFVESHSGNTCIHCECRMEDVIQNGGLHLAFLTAKTEESGLFAPNPAKFADWKE